jgi:hypothetical protein
MLINIRSSVAHVDSFYGVSSGIHHDLSKRDDMLVQL